MALLSDIAPSAEFRATIGGRSHGLSVLGDPDDRADPGGALPAQPLALDRPPPVGPAPVGPRP